MIGIYFNSPTAGGTDGSRAVSGNAITVGPFDVVSGAIGDPVKLAARGDAGESYPAGATVTISGASAAKWALAPDNSGTPGTFGAYGAALTLSGSIAAVNVIFWAKPISTAGETPAADSSVSFTIAATEAVLGAVTASAGTLRKLGAPLENCLSLTVNLQAGVLSDKYSMEFNSEQVLDTRWMDSIYGWDWSAKAISVQATHRQVETLNRWKVTAGYDVDEILRKPINFPNSLTGANDIMTHVASQIGKTPRFYFGDFNIKPFTDTPTVIDIVGRLFSWSNQIPTMRINVFLRNDELWVVQRGYEPSTYALDKTKNGEAVITQEHIYTLNNAADSAGNPKKGTVPLQWDPDNQYVSGSWSGPGGSHVTVNSGLLASETVVTDAESTTTTYSYNRTLTNAYMTSKVTEITGEDYTKTVATYRSYGNTSASFGYISCETTTTTETKNGNTTSSERKTYYSPRGINAYSVAVYENGKFISGATVPGRAPSGAESFMTANDSRIPRPEKETSAELLNDYNLPFTDSGKVDEVVAEIERIDGLVQETPALPSRDAHVIDFTEKITYDGATYYLDANQITVLPTLTTQNVQMVRVY